MKFDDEGRGSEEAKTGKIALRGEQKGASGASKYKIFDKKDKKVGKKFGIIRY